jgi:TPR repeat protein
LNLKLCTASWYQKAAEQENAGAQYNLGNMYDFGKGVLKDAKQAASWYQKAAEFPCLAKGCHSFNAAA